MYLGNRSSAHYTAPFSVEHQVLSMGLLFQISNELCHGLSAVMCAKVVAATSCNLSQWGRSPNLLFNMHQRHRFKLYIYYIYVLIYTFSSTWLHFESYIICNSCNVTDSHLGVMPAYSSSDDALATKLVAFYPENKDQPTHQAWVLMQDPKNGNLDAVGTRHWSTNISWSCSQIIHAPVHWMIRSAVGLVRAAAYYVTASISAEPQDPCNGSSKLPIYCLIPSGKLSGLCC